MNTRTRLIFGVGAVASGLLAYRNVRGVLDPFSGATGGIGAVSFDFVDFAVVYLAAILGNVALKAWARRHGPWAVRWRRTHLFTTLAFLTATLTLGWGIGSIFGIADADSAKRAFIALFVLSDLELPVQALFVAGYVAIAFGGGSRQAAG